MPMAEKTPTGCQQTLFFLILKARILIDFIEKKVQGYAGEETSLMEDFRHGLLFGTKQFADDIRKGFFQDAAHKDLPQQRLIAKEFDPSDLISEISKTLQIDLDKYIQSKRLRGIDKQNRDLILYFLWSSGRLSNTEIGSLFSMSYSAVSHSVASFKKELNQNKKLKHQVERLNSRFKL